MSIYDYTVKDRSGNDVSMEQFKGKVMLIVNTATGCGFTPQYEGLEKLYETYHEQGLEVLDFPCNQFGNQAPGNDEEIHEFCTFKYKTQFDQFKKVDVYGENEDPLWKYLKSQKGFEGFGKGPSAMFMENHLKKIDPNYSSNPDIKWNFTKFLVDRNGEVVARFEPTKDMKEVKEAVAAELKK